MLSMKDPVTKGIRMHQDGEIDTRSIYTCLVVARILNILTPGTHICHEISYKTSTPAAWLLLCYVICRFEFN